MTSSKPKGRDPKMKPWRKGKSKNANKKGSIKSQIRSKQRLLSKITDEEIKQRIMDDIHQLEVQMKSNKKKELERKFAVKYHQVKFFERQKLTRMEKKIQNKLKDAKAAVDLKDVEKYKTQLEQICMDQLYVAYYPKDEKYMALFANNGVRMVDDDTTWNKREQIRQSIIRRIQSGEIDCTKSWVNMKVLKDKDFVVDMKNIVMVMDDQDLEKVKKIQNEQRFQLDTNTTASNAFETFHNDDDKRDKNEGHDDILQSSEKTRETIDDDDDDDMANHVLTIGQSDSSSSSNDSSSDGTSDDSNSSDDSSSSSSSDSEDSDSEEDDDDDDDDDDKDRAHTSKSKDQQNEDNDMNNSDESEDDFLVDDIGKGDIKEVFKHAKREANYERKGDKSQGWKTQKQQPNQWKRHRTR